MRKLSLLVLFLIISLFGGVVARSANRSSRPAAVQTAAGQVQLSQYVERARYSETGRYLWKRPKKVTSVVLIGCGGGGGGGGAGGAINVVNPILSDNGGGGGGGAGAECRAITIPVNASSYIVEVGRGGKGGGPGPSRGNGGLGENGTATKFGPSADHVGKTTVPVDTRTELFAGGPGGSGGTGARPPENKMVHSDEGKGMHREYLPHDGRGGAGGSCSACTAGGKGGDPGHGGGAGGQVTTSYGDLRPGGKGGEVHSDHGGGGGGGGGASMSSGGNGGLGGDDGTATAGLPQLVLKGQKVPGPGENSRCEGSPKIAAPAGAGGGGGGGNGGMDYAGAPGGCGGAGLLLIYGKR
jgi:hypothetical protein